MKQRISLLGMPLNSGQPKVGTHLGPKALRDAKIVERLQELNYAVTDLGDVALDDFVAETGDNNLKNLDHVLKSNVDLATAVEKIDMDSEFPFILGGDHSMAIGTLAGLGKKFDNLGVIWFDAHGDLNVADTSPSGNIHGMSMAASLGIGHEVLVNVGGYTPKMKIRNTVLIAARDLDEGEVKLIEEIGMRVYTMDDVNRLGMDKVMEETLEYLKDCDGIHLSYDVDALSPELTPGTGTRVPGGVTREDGVKFLDALRKADVVTSLELVEVNPNLEDPGQEGMTAANAVDIIMSLFG